MQDMGIEIADVLLHVGLGTFRPVSAENVEEHHMHSEYYEMSEESAQRINRARQNGGRIIAVGTTSCRTLESVADRINAAYACERPLLARGSNGHIRPCRRGTLPLLQLRRLLPVPVRLTVYQYLHKILI